MATPRPSALVALSRGDGIAGVADIQVGADNGASILVETIAAEDRDADSRSGRIAEARRLVGALFSSPTKGVRLRVTYTTSLSGYRIICCRSAELCL